VNPASAGPTTAPDWHRRGRDLQLQGDHDGAQRAYLKALELDPGYLRSLNNLAVLAMAAQRPDQADQWLGRGLAAVTRWDDPAAPLLLNSLCQLRLQQQRPLEALATAKTLVQLAPEPSAWSNLAVALQWSCRPRQACTAQAMALGAPLQDPLQALWQGADGPQASAGRHVQLQNLATMELSLDPWGRRGWQLLQARLACNKDHWQTNLAPPPWTGLWQGQPVQELLVWDEQGYGDAIQALRWLPAAARRCQRLRLGLRPELLALVERRLALPGHCKLEPLGSDGAPWQQGLAHLPLMGLPLALGLEGQAIATGTHLKRLRPPRPGGRPPRLGLVWAAGRKGEAEADRHARSRSLPLDGLMAVLAPLVRQGRLQLQALQVGADGAEADGFAEVLAPTPPLGDWEATAALLEQLDGLISVDTGTAHLGASLGLPTLMLLNTPCDWRWGALGESTPWYPTMRLVRYSAMQTLGAQLGEALQTWH